MFPRAERAYEKMMDSYLSGVGVPGSAIVATAKVLRMEATQKIEYADRFEQTTYIGGKRIVTDPGKKAVKKAAEALAGELYMLALEAGVSMTDPNEQEVIELDMTKFKQIETGT